MESLKVANWLQIVGNFGVIVGLVFVGYQLYQDRELKRAELAFASINSSIQVSLAGLGENVHESVAKSVTEPGSLTDAETFELARLYHAEFFVARQVYLMQLFGMFPEGLGGRVDPLFHTSTGVNFIAAELDNYGLNPEVERKWLEAISSGDVSNGLQTYLADLRSERPVSD